MGVKTGTADAALTGTGQTTLKSASLTLLGDASGTLVLSDGHGGTGAVILTLVVGTANGYERYVERRYSTGAYAGTILQANITGTVEYSVEIE